MHKARSPGRSLSAPSKSAAACAMISDAMLSFPPRRPPMTHNSRTRCFGGSRSAMERKNASSRSSILSAKAAFRMQRHANHKSPSPTNHGAEVRIVHHALNDVRCARHPSSLSLLEIASPASRRAALMRSMRVAATSLPGDAFGSLARLPEGLASISRS